jgi:hypothetical protein
MARFASWFASINSGSSGPYQNAWGRPSRTIRYRICTHCDDYAHNTRESLLPPKQLHPVRPQQLSAADNVLLPDAAGRTRA